MLIKFSEQTVDKFYIPSFILTKGDIIIIQLPNGPYFRPVELKMIDMLTGKQHNDLIEINTPLKYVEHIVEKSFWHRLFPMTVGGYLDKYANKANQVCKTIYINNVIAESFDFNRNRPVVVLTYSDNNQDPMQFRQDHWSWNLTNCIATNPHRMATKDRSIAPAISDLKTNREFEISKDADKPLSIWHNGFLEACRNPNLIINELKK